MALSLKSVTLSRPDAANDPQRLRVAVGSETFDFYLRDLHAIWDGDRSHCNPLLFQFLVALVQANLNPRNATPAQLKAEIESHQYWWGN